MIAWAADGYHPEEIAAVLDLREDNVRANLHKARRALTGLLGDES
ncbi:hypothetical protein [Actinokineospora sp. NBRC 105648]|nr:hypothetical protein [Actinokineospora sp. NBRC 105648]GLZ41294.1 hypothetical protein Acsp05_49180 [Actinokineospora sp. NBRC 105648]